MKVLADSQQKIEGISPTAHRELNDANHHVSLEADPSPAESTDLANTFTAALHSI